MNRLTKAQAAQLDDICAEAFAKIAEMDLRFYHLGYVTHERRWSRPAITQGAGKRYGDTPNSTVIKPSAPELLPGGGAANDILQKAVAGMSIPGVKLVVGGKR